MRDTAVETVHGASRRGFLKVAGAAGLASFAGCISGSESDADFPERDITLVVPYSAGGGYDTLGRLVGQHLGDELGVNVAIENVTGGGGTIAAEQVYREDPDGYTMVIWNSMGFGRHNLLRDMEYDTAEMTFYAQGVRDEQAIGVRPDAGIETIDDFIEATQNEELTFGTQGMLNDGTLNPLLLGLMSGLYEPERVHDNLVVLDGTGEAMNEMVAGRIDVIGSNYYGLRPYEEDGEVNVLMILRMFEEPTLLDAPFEEQSPYAETLQTADIPGGEDIEAMTANVRAFVGPPDVPEERTETIRNAFDTVLQSEELIADGEERSQPINYEDAETARENALTAISLWEENRDLLQELEDS